MEDKLTHHVILEGWPAVAKALREFKKKRHVGAGFYPVVTQLVEEQYEVKIYQTRKAPS